MIFTKICMPSWRRLLSLGPNVVGGVGKPGAQGWHAPLVSDKLPRQGPCRGCRGCPGKGSAGGACPVLLLFVFVSWRCFDHLAALTPPSALLSVAVGTTLTAPAQVRGTKECPYFSTPIDMYCIVAIEDKKMGFSSYCLS